MPTPRTARIIVTSNIQAFIDTAARRCQPAQLDDVTAAAVQAKDPHEPDSELVLQHQRSPLVRQLRTRFSKPLRRAFTTQTARRAASTLSTSVTTMALVWRLQSPMTSPARTAFFPSALQLVLTFFFAFAHYMAMTLSDQYATDSPYKFHSRSFPSVSAQVIWISSSTRATIYRCRASRHTHLPPIAGVVSLLTDFLLKVQAPWWSRATLQ
ncbi:hypothetical protein V8E53_000348 [Lactarius tabidus]